MSKPEIKTTIIEASVFIFMLCAFGYWLYFVN